MKKQNKKAFTLVELLVVIAILAILASVAVIGYTSFIKNAAISNDDNVIAQMNRYLEALQADSTSDFYGVTIDDSNFPALLKEIENSGLGKVEPHAEKYGYHYYFNKTKQKFELVDNSDALNTVGRHFSLFVRAAGEDSYQTLSPYSCFTQGGNYCLADTAGEWAELVRDFAEVTNSDNLTALYDGASNMKVGNKTISGLAALVKATVFVTEAGNFVVSNDVTHTNITVQNGSYAISGTKTPLSGDSVVISESSTLFAPDAQGHVITIPADVTYVSPNFMHVTAGEYTVKVVFGQESAEQIAAILEAGTKTSGVVLENINGAEVKTEQKDGVDGFGTYVTVDGIDAFVGEKNTVIDFEINIAGDKMNLDGDTKYIAWDGTYTFTASDFKGSVEGQPVVSESVIWTVTARDIKGADYSNFVSISSNGELTFKLNGDVAPQIDYITVKAQAISGGYEETLDFAVVRIESVSGLKLTYNDNGNTVSDDVTSKMTLLNSGDAAQDYTISYDNVVLNHTEAPTNLCAGDIAWTYDGKGADKEGTTVISALGEGKGTLKINIGSYVTYPVTLDIASIKDFTFVPTSTNFKFLGNGNEVLLSDLFTLKNEDVELPEGAYLVIYNGIEFDDDTYMNPHRGLLPKTSSGESGLTVDSPSQLIELDEDETFNDISIQFNSTTNNNETIRIAIVQNGVRISNDIVVEVINATNIRDYTGTDGLTSTLNASNAFTKNIVLMEKITMEGDVNYLTIGENYTLYGNGFEFDIKAGREEEAGIINLSGKIQDIKIVGEVYPTFAKTVGDQYGSSAVRVAGDKASIYNSYIANTRSPLRVEKNVTIKDTVLFGGRYSNIDIIGGTVRIEGTVTTVQQLYDGVIGLGVSAWFGDSKKYVDVATDANFVQYNFIDSSLKGNMPSIVLLGTEVMDLKKPFQDMFDKTDIYGEYMFNDNTYVNSGMISTDMYMLNYIVEGDGVSIGFMKMQLGKGKTKTLTLNSNVPDDAIFTVEHDSRFTCNLADADKDTAGLQLTGAQLKEGVKFTVNTAIEYPITKELWDKHKFDLSGYMKDLGDGTNYMFQIQSDDYKTINVSSKTNNIDNYSSIPYTFEDEGLGGQMNIADGLLGAAGKQTLGERGLHYGRVSVEVYTPKQTSYAYGTTTYEQLLGQYIEMTNGDGKNDNFYTPENFKFVNGSVTNYWAK